MVDCQGMLLTIGWQLTSYVCSQASPRAKKQNLPLPCFSLVLESLISGATMAPQMTCYGGQYKLNCLKVIVLASKAVYREPLHMFCAVDLDKDS